eukprot:6839833-Karenia_brevis.AAC.1
MQPPGSNKCLLDLPNIARERLAQSVRAFASQSGATVADCAWLGAACARALERGPGWAQASPVVAQFL